MPFMRASIVASAAGHLAFLLGVFVLWANPSLLQATPPPSITVDLVSPDEMAAASQRQPVRPVQKEKTEPVQHAEPAAAEREIPPAPVASTTPSGPAALAAKV